MAQPRQLGYNARDLLSNQMDALFNDPMDEANGSYANSFGDAVAPGSIASGSLIGLLQQEFGAIFAGKGSFNNSETGYRLGIDESDGLAKFYIGDASNYLNWTGTALNIAGTFSAGSIDIGGSDATSFHVDSDGNMWLGASSFAAAPAKISNAGAGTFSSITITGGTITGTPIASIPNNSSTDISLLEYTHNLVFSVTDNNTVAWASGTITMSNARTFSITGSNTGNMAARTYIYLDTGTSTTALQTTTTVATAMGANKILIAVAENGSGQATYQVYGGIGGLKVGSAGVNIANNNWTYSGTWSVTDADTVAWGSGTLKTSDGTSYSITGSNTGNMSAKTYIYFDLGTSSTAFQTTTTATTAIGDGKILIAIAQNGTGEANFMVMNDKQVNIDASSIVAGSITANEIAAGAITAAKISVSSLSAITADMGTITAGTITLNTSGYIRGGQTAYGTGTGFFLGYSGGAYKLSIGVGESGLTWDGSTLTVNGYKVQDGGTFGGDGSDSSYAQSSGTDTMDLGGARVYIMNFTTLSLTGTAKIAFSNPHANGTIVIFRVQGNCTINSSTLPTIDLRGIGAAGGDTGGGTPVAGNDASFNPKDVSMGGLTGASNGDKGGGGASSIADGTSAAGVGGTAPYPNIGATDADALLLFGYSFILPGGGGGAGNEGGGFSASVGGRGGGAFILEVGGTLTLVGSGAINANGSDSSAADADGGAGGGGAIAVLYRTAGTITGTVTATATGTNGVSGGTGFAVVTSNKYRS
jgi:hypothetical protein